MSDRCSHIPFASFFAAAALTALPASANGVFPSADQLVIDPADPSHVVARTTYGLLSSRDGGATWDWICEPAIGAGANWHPPVAFATEGALLAALPDGLSIGTDGECGWTRAQELAGLTVVDLSTERADPSRAVAVAAGPVDTVWESFDGGSSWARTEGSLPSGFSARTIDAAPSDPQRIYVSGIFTDGAGVTTGQLVRSVDRGQTWEALPIPGSSAAHTPYIGGVDPANAEVVYVRLAGAPGRLLASTDGGLSWRSIYGTMGFVRAFAISPDGATIAIGSDIDGVWRAPSSTMISEKVSSVSPRCFTWTAEGLYMCATEFVDGFTIGLSTDGGATFAPLLHQPCIRGPLSCGASSPVDALCPSLWPQTAMVTSHMDCQPDAGTASGGGESGGPTSSSTGSDGAGGRTPVGSSQSAGGSDGAGANGGGSSTGDPPRGGGCATCALAGGSSEAGWTGAAVTLAVAGACAARRRRASDSMR